MKARMICAATATAFGALVCAAPSLADSDNKLPYPNVTDASHATRKVEEIFEGFFTAKSLHNGAQMLTFWAADPVLYIDATAGQQWPTRAALAAIWEGFLPLTPPTALSYPLRIIGDEHSALVEMEDNQQLFGQELRILASVTFNDRHQIIRWIDYWDGRSALGSAPIGPTYPADFNDGVENASPVIKNAANALQAAFASGDAATATALFTPDAVFEDMALHTRVEGQLQIQRYLTRGLNLLPYGVGASVAHVVGSDQGGGYEWLASQPASAPLKRGNTALELDATGKISRFTVIYDSNQFPLTTYQLLVGLAAEQ